VIIWRVANDLVQHASGRPVSHTHHTGARNIAVIPELSLYVFGLSVAVHIKDDFRARTWRNQSPMLAGTSRTTQ
jgi:hypothetical protein